MNLLKKAFFLPVLLIPLLLLFVTYDFFGQSEIEAYQIESFQNEYDLNSHLYILDDPENKFSINEIWSDKLPSFRKFNQEKVLNPTYVYWLNVKLSPSTNQNFSFRNYKLFIGEPDFSTVYLVNTSGSVLQEKTTGSLLPSTEKELFPNYRNQRVDLDFNLEEPLQLFIKIQKIDGHQHDIDVRLRKYDFYQSLDFIDATKWNWLFLGFLITMFMFFSLIFFGTKDKAFLYHALYIAGVFAFTMDFFGVTENLPLIKRYPVLQQGFDILAVALADIAYFLFIRYYLNLNKLLPKWDKIFYNLILFKVFFFPVMILYYYISFNEPLVDKIISIFLIAEYILAFSFLVPLYKTRHRRGYFIIAGSLFLFISIFLNGYALIFEKGIWTMMTQFGVAGEIICFSLGLGFRFKELREEEKRAHALRELNTFKSKLYSNISHEFRTPLTIIRGISEEIKESAKKMSPQTIKENFNAIERNCDDLLRLSNQMLDLSKLESKSMSLNLQADDIVVLVRECIKNFRTEAAKKKIDLNFNSEFRSFETQVDSPKFLTILTNLLSNAIKFTPGNGEVHVELSRKDSDEYECLELIISDTGFGISSEDLPYIFDRFYRSEDTEEKATGTGIGLALVKELIGLMKWDISVKSKKGEGSSFSIEIPYTKPSTGVTDDSPVVIKDEIHQLEFMDDKPVVLLVEDNEDILNYLEAILKSSYIIKKASDGMQGVELALKIIPDLIISDIMMPLKDGITLCKELKENEKTSHIPVVLLTAKIDFDSKLEGLESGADAYLTKPFRKEELLVRLKKLNDIRKKLQKKYSQFVLLKEKDVSLKENSFVHKVHGFIDDNMQNNQFSVEMLAELLGLSRMQLHRKLKAITGKSASHYIRAYRLHKSIPLFSDASLTIADISWEAGFQDPNYYSKSFQKEFGMTPSEYRKTKV
ncbi:MAG: response regulator [Bacteroidia bacterium]|nr:response regulator [Bacteroidia bacterium]